MRILAGRYKSHPLKTPKGSTTRPTTSKIRESLFNILQHQLENARLLDLFAGSGAIGLEALSRGAQSVTFVENDKGAISCLKENLKTLHAEGTVIQSDVVTALKRLAKQQALFDIIFADPPYALEIAPVLELIPPLLSPEGIVIVEQGKRTQLKPTSLQITDQRSFGDTVLFFLHPK